MKLLKKLLAALALVPAMTLASEGGFPLDRAPDRSNDLSALQNGARLFVNYCLNCHSASLVRYNRLRDIGLSEQQIQDNLLFTTDKVGDLMNVSLNARQAKDWLGATPPDPAPAGTRPASASIRRASTASAATTTGGRRSSGPTGWRASWGRSATYSTSS